MPRTRALDDELAPFRRPGWTRESIKAALERRYSPRLHMSMILAASGFSAMLASWFLLDFGVHAMLVRYPVAIALAYATFLVGVWTWLRAMGFVDNDGKRQGGGSDLVSGVDIPSGGGSGGGIDIASRAPLPRGGGGIFDGGGASTSFAESRAPLVAANLQGDSAPASRVSSSGGKGGGSLFDIDGDGIVLLVLAIALVAVVFATSGYLIWCAPDVLTEAAFGAMLTGSLARTTKRQTSEGWIGGVLKKTWWPFALVMLVAIVFAGYAAAHFPEASTFRQAVALALQ